MSLKRKWSEFEDIQLYELIRIFGTQRWPEIGDLMPGRTGRQCRERWNHRLNPNLVKGNWSEEEDSIILREKDNFGGSWAKLSRLLPGRNDNDIRNRYFALTRHTSSSDETDENVKYNEKDSEIKEDGLVTNKDDEKQDNDKLSDNEEDSSKSKIFTESKDNKDQSVIDSKVESSKSSMSTDDKSPRKNGTKDIIKVPQKEEKKSLSILEIQEAKLKELERKRALAVLFNRFPDNSKRTKLANYMYENGQYPLPSAMPVNYPLMPPHFMGMSNGFGMQGMVPPVPYMMGNNAAAGGSLSGMMPDGMMSPYQYDAMMTNQQNAAMMAAAMGQGVPMPGHPSSDYGYYGQWMPSMSGSYPSYLTGMSSSSSLSAGGLSAPSTARMSPRDDHKILDSDN